MVGYSLHQLLRYVAAHSGWHLLLPVMGDSQRVPNGAEALGELVDGAAVAADGRISTIGVSVHLRPSWYLPSRRWPTGLSQSLCLTITSMPARDADVMVLGIAPRWLAPSIGRQGGG